MGFLAGFMLFIMHLCDNQQEKVMEIPTNEKIQEFITNHLGVEDFGYLVLAGDERLNHEALSAIRRKFRAFLEGESDG
jgi:hypothetical protein